MELRERIVVVVCVCVCGVGGGVGDALNPVGGCGGDDRKKWK